MAAFTLLVSIAISTQLAPSADPRPIPITGVVVDPAGKPVPDVAVWLIDGLPPGVRRLFGRRIVLDGAVHQAGRGPAARVPGDANRRRGQVRARNTRRVRRPTLAESSGTRCRPARQRLAIKRLPVPLCSELAQSTWLLQRLSEPKFGFSIWRESRLPGQWFRPARSTMCRSPTSLGRQLGGTTDGKGQVVLAAVPRCAQEFLVDAPGFGKPAKPDRTRAGDEASARSGGPVGWSSGCSRERADPGRDGSGHARSWADSRARGRAGWRKSLAMRRAGSRFRPSRRGSLRLSSYLITAMGPRLRNEPYHGIVLPAGKTTELTIPLRPDHPDHRTYSASRGQAGQSPAFWWT